MYGCVSRDDLAWRTWPGIVIGYQLVIRFLLLIIPSDLPRTTPIIIIIIQCEQ